MKTKLEKRMFYVGESALCPGYDLTPFVGKWNGWDSPAFTKGQAEVALRELEIPYRFYEASYAFVLFEGTIYEERVSGTDEFPTEDGRLYLYPIGAWAWTWVAE